VKGFHRLIRVMVLVSLRIMKVVLHVYSLRLCLDPSGSILLEHF